MSQKLLNYEVVERLGEGAKSTIYDVIDPVTKQHFALKHVVRTDPKDLRFIEQMEAEFAISKMFSHPALRRSFDLKIIKTMLVKVNEAFLVMELFDGKALDVYLPPTTLEVVDVFIQAAQGLKALHAMGYVHCDIKPNNILRNKDGLVKVIDFGQSAKIGTVKERIQGTPDFIAPEQVTRKPISTQTDIFNLGATLYWAVTAKHIPTAYTVNKKGENSFLLDSRIDTPSELNPKVPAPLSNLIMECIAQRPQKRPENMDQVITRLELSKHVMTRPTPTTPTMSDSSLSDSNF
jgi:serine/threonine protein kinase